MAESAKWYVVHTYSGYENTVKATIEKTIETRQLQDLIHVVSIPMETVTEITDNGPKTYDRKVFPGYVLVKMVMTDESWYIIKNVRGVHWLCRLRHETDAADGRKRSSGWAWTSTRLSLPTMSAIPS